MEVGVSLGTSTGRNTLGDARRGVVRKLDTRKVQWIIRQKAKGEMTNAEIGAAMGVSAVCIRKLWAKHRRRKLSEISHPAPLGRPAAGLPGRREHSAVLSARYANEHGAVQLVGDIEEGTGLHIPHNVIHQILVAEGLAERQRRKSGQRKWIRYERKYSNSMWHTDYKLLDDGRWFIAYQDDASRFIVGFGVFDNATGEHAIKVLKEAIARHGKPASVLTDHGSQFYANEKEAAAKGEAKFEKELVALGIRHILARVNHPQTNGKLERFHGELQRRLPNFVNASSSKTAWSGSRKPGGRVGNPFYSTGSTDPVARLVHWYNYDRTHMSLNKGETPAKAFARKMPTQDAEAIEDAQRRPVKA